MIIAAQIIGVQEVDEAFLCSCRQQIAILPCEKHGAGRSQIEILSADVLPVQRQIVIDQVQILQRDGGLGIGIIAGSRVEDPIGGTTINTSIGTDDRAAAPPDSCGIRIGEQHLVNHRTVPVPDIDRIEAGQALAAPLRQHGVYHAIHQIQAPVFGIRRYKLNGAIPHHTASEIEPVESPVAGNHKERIRALVNYGRRRNAIRTEKRSLVSALPREYDVLERVVPQLFAGLGVERKDGPRDSGNVDDAANTLDSRDSTGHDRGGQSR